MALPFKNEPLLGRKYSTTIYGSINQLLGTNLEGWRTATYPAYGNQDFIYPKFQEPMRFFYLGIPKDLSG